jgi:predicted translin family RNA/ssDNA-binding protein
MSQLFVHADTLKELKEKKKSLEEEVKELNKLIDSEEAALIGLMVEEEMQNFSRAGSLFYLNTKTMASALPDQKDQLYQALKIEGFGDLVYETVNAQSLSAFVKEQISENEDQLPEWLDGLVKVYEKTAVGIRKSGK